MKIIILKACNSFVTVTFDMKKGFALLIAGSVLIFSCSLKSNKDIKAFTAMNTFMTVTTYGKNCQTANQMLEKRIYEIENAISTTNPESEVFKINASSQEVPLLLNRQETINLLDFSVNMSKKTDGAFNYCLFPVIKLWGFTTDEFKVPSDREIQEKLKLTDYSKVNFYQEEEKSYIKKKAGMMLDFGALGKGYAGDEALKILKSYGIESALLDLGGNIQALGLKTDGQEWKVGIKSPWDGSVIAGVRINDECMITSGGYERFFTGQDGKKYIHIFDGKRGYPVENEIESVTIICKSGLLGDALSTSLFVMGLEKAIAFWKSEKSFEMVIITKDKKIYYSEGLKDRLWTIFNFAEEVLIEE